MSTLLPWLPTIIAAIGAAIAAGGARSQLADLATALKETRTDVRAQIAQLDSRVQEVVLAKAVSAEKHMAHDTAIASIRDEIRSIRASLDALRTETTETRHAFREEIGQRLATIEARHSAGHP